MKPTHSGAAVILISLLALLGGCKSKAEKAYANCMSQMEKATNEATGANEAKTEAEKAFAQTAGTMVQAMGASVCQAVKSACDKDPEGAVCAAAISQYQ